MRFVNFSNHPSDKWSAGQREEAERYGEILDIVFPEVPPRWTKEQVAELAGRCTEEILKAEPAMVLCQGEFTLVYQVVQRLKEQGIKVVAACSERRVTEEDGKKIVEFVFEGFREY